MPHSVLHVYYIWSCQHLHVCDKLSATENSFISFQGKQKQMPKRQWITIDKG